MANVQHLDMYCGEARTFALAGRDSSNLPSNLTSKTVAWYVGRSPFRPGNCTPIVTKAGSVVSAGAGTFTASVVRDDTQDLNGDFEHMAVASDAGGNRSVICQGRFRVRPVIAP